jgi:UV DNA damage endonuclease
MRELKRKNKQTSKNETVLQPPVWTGHADYVNPFEFITFMRTLPKLEFDVMLEAKAKDLALERLRRDLPRYAPDVAERFGIAHNPSSQEISDAIDITEEMEIGN